MAKEKYAQMGYLTVTESAPATLTFGGLSVYSNVLGQKGMLIHNVEYNIPSATLALMTASTDNIVFGLAGDDSASSVDLADAEVYDYNAIRRIDFGTAGNGHLFHLPFTKDFSTLPGGGKLVPADRLFAYVQSGGLASGAAMTIRFHFTIVELSASDYLELAQALRVLK